MTLDSSSQAHFNILAERLFGVEGSGGGRPERLVGMMVRMDEGEAQHVLAGAFHRQREDGDLPYQSFIKRSGRWISVETGEGYEAIHAVRGRQQGERLGRPVGTQQKSAQPDAGVLAPEVVAIQRRRLVGGEGVAVVALGGGRVGGVVEDSERVEAPPGAVVAAPVGALVHRERLRVQLRRLLGVTCGLDGVGAVVERIGRAGVRRAEGPHREVGGLPEQGKRSVEAVAVGELDGESGEGLDAERGLPCMAHGGPHERRRRLRVAAPLADRPEHDLRLGERIGVPPLGQQADGLLARLAQRREVDAAAVIWFQPALDVCNALGADPWATLASGTLLAAFAPDDVEVVMSELSLHGYQASMIGQAKLGTGVVDEHGRSIALPKRDEVARILSVN